MADESEQPLLDRAATDDDPTTKEAQSWSDELFQIVKLCGPAVVQLCFQQVGCCKRGHQCLLPHRLLLIASVTAFRLQLCPLSHLSPADLAFFLSLQAMIVTNQVMAGHLGKNELAAVAISLT